MTTDASFVQKYDILKLVKEIQKHTCLYDFTSPDHTDRVKTATAWVDISNALGFPVRDCKEKWRKIRIAFTRSVKLLKSSHPPTRPYHLSDCLQFLVPFLRTENGSSSPGDQHTHTKEYAEVNVERIKEEYHYDDYDVEISDYNALEEQDSITNESYEAAIADVAPKIPQKREHVEDNYRESISPRKMFLLSLLPDVESLSEQEMRVFRRLTVSVIDDIISKREPKKNNDND